LHENLSVTGGIAIWSIAFVLSTITDTRHTPIITNIETPTMRGMERRIDVQLSHWTAELTGQRAFSNSD